MLIKVKKYIRNFFKHRTYLDYASLTPIDKRVSNEMQKFSSSEYANPSSFYKEGVMAKEVLKNSRAEIASYIHSHPSEIYFTSGGTESNNLAILGVIESLHEKGVEYDKMHVIISVIEHSSVRECANHLSNLGVEVESVFVDEHGVVSVDEIKNKIKSNTVIVSIMTVNNEIGSVQPIREIAKMIRHFRANLKKVDNDLVDAKVVTDQVSAFNFQDFAYPVFHTDASQAFLFEEINIEKLGVDLLTLDSSKVYGPRGFGLLYVKKTTPIVSVIFGGGQESDLRSGTENIPAIRGFAKALEIVNKNREVEVKRVVELRDYFIKELKKIRGDIKVNGSGSPFILNVTIPKIDNEFFVLQLDAKGISCSTKSSCLGDDEESYVLNAIDVKSKESVRFSFGRWTKKRDLLKVIEVIRKILS